MTRTIVRKDGDDPVVELPAEIVDGLGSKEGDTLHVRADGPSLVVSRYRLQDLLDQCDLSAPMVLTDEERAWMDAPPVGLEVI